MGGGIVEPVRRSGLGALGRHVGCYGWVAAAVGPFFESVVDQSLWVALSVSVGRFHLICKYMWLF